MKLVRLFAFLALPVALSPAYSQPAAPQRSGNPIIAVVNGELITQHDLDLRLKLALYSSNLSDTPEMRAKVREPLLRRMIDEDLKIQAVAKAKYLITPENVADQMASIERQNHLPAGGLAKVMATNGIDLEALRQQVRGDIAWATLMHQILIHKVHVSDNAVASRIEAIRANFGKPEYHAAEIYLSVDDANDESSVHDLAERLTDQMRQGAPFEAIARQFTQSGGASDGDLGWVSEGMLDDEVMKALQALQPGAVTPPIRTTDGYHIVTLREKRKVGDGFGGGATVDLLTIDLKSLSTAGPAERDVQMARLREILAPAKSCEDLIELARQAPSAAVERSEKLPETQVQSNVAPLIKDLAPGKISEPIDTAKGRRFFALCGRGAAQSAGVPSADEVRRQMEDQQLELVARHYLLDLHSDAVVDIRKQ